MKAPKNFVSKINEQILQTSRGKILTKHFNGNGTNHPDHMFWIFENGTNAFKGHCLLFELDWSKYYLKIKRCPNGQGTNGVWIDEKTFTKKDCISLQHFMVMIKNEIELLLVNKII